MLLEPWLKLHGRYVSIFLNGKAVAQVVTTRYLGVFIDQNLSWKFHVNYVLSKVRCKLYALHRLRPLPDHLLSQLYQAFILPVFAIDYCDVVWMPTTAVLSKCLERLHSRFLQGLSKMLFFCQTNINRETSFPYCCLCIYGFASSLSTIFERLVCVY